MDKLRLGMESISKGRVDDPEFLRDSLQDLLALAAFGLAGLLSLGLTGGVTRATSWALEALGLEPAPGLFLLTPLLGLGPALHRKSTPLNSRHAHNSRVGFFLERNIHAIRS